MPNSGVDVSAMPLIALIIIGVLALVQLGLMIWALVRLVGDKRYRVAGLPRLVWGVIIVLGELIGPIVFLILHSRELHDLAAQEHFARMNASAQRSESRDASSVIENLYE
ncbi:MAG: hypothetical protein Q4E01_07445, partial [Actinomycetaceae bacterium]|nr:hypothetical protein [Actinomycetaceae bacterium]